MAEAEIKQLEQYIFSDQKSDFINTLISGTDSFYYFHLNHALNAYGLELSKEHLDNLEKYKKFNTTRAQNIKLRYNFLLLAKPDKTEAERKALLQEINKNTLHFNFDFDEPKTVVSTTITSSKQEINNILDPILLDWNIKLEASYNDLSIFNTLEDVALSQMDLKKLAIAGNIDVIRTFLGKASLGEYKWVEELICEYIGLNKKKNKNYQFESQYFIRLTLEQMMRLGNYIPDLNKNMNYIGELFIKQFEIDREDKGQFLGTPEEKLERKAKLTKMYEWTRNLTHKFDSLTDQLLYEILQLGIETNHFDFDLFIEYLRNPKKIYSYANAQQMKTLQNRKQVYENYWHNVHNCNVSKWLNDDKLVHLYLEAYFKLNKKIEPFDEFLTGEYLKELFYKVRLYEGEQIPNITEILSQNVLKAVQDEKMISICKFNREYFTSKEEVKLYVEIKNVSNMTIKIFEFSAEDYYLKKNAEIAGDINLDGLIASEETYLDFKDPPQRKIIKEFKFENITKKPQGIFIVEFIGFGLSSRALIRKGKLILLEKATLAGQLFTILDEDLEICKRTQRTGLWVEGRFHEANENGVVNLPFSNNSSRVQSIIVHNNFACLTNLNLITEAYNFKCSYLYKDEGFIMGNKMKVLIQPRLYLNQQAVSLDIIQEPSVTIVTITDTDIPSTIVLDKIKFDYRQELEIETTIPAKLKSIIIQVKGKIKKMTSGTEEVELYNEHNIMINNYLNENNFCGLFLKYSEQGYEVYVLGKNGEPKKNVVLNIELNHRYLKSQINAQLQTQQDGKVVLGDLKNVFRIRASIREKGDIKAHPNEWFIANFSKVKYPKVLNICKGDSVNMPYFGKELNKNKVAFSRVLNVTEVHRQSMITNNIANLKLSKNTLVIEGLEVGLYYLTIKDENLKMEIHVHEGTYWKNTNLMVMKDYLLHISKSMPTIVIEDVEIKDAKDNEQLSFSIFSDDMKTTRIHIFAYQFLNNNVNRYCDNIQSNIEKENFTLIPNVKNRNQYLSNKTLGDEYCYVLNRKKESRYVGNNLEKPQILLKRTFLRDTTLEKEDVEAGSGFKENIQYDENKRRMEERIVHQGQIETIRADEKYNGLNKEESIDGFLNFLQQPSLILSNIKPNLDGKIVLEDLNLRAFSTIEIVATNLNTVIHELHPLKKKPIFTRDLRQVSSDEKSKKFYSIYRNSSNLSKGEKFKVDDLTSTELQIIDSLEKLFNIQKELRKGNGAANSENGKNYDDWKFVTKWNSLDIDEKLKKYDEYASHELNLFLFFKDRAYFDGYVRPFIQNKIEKTFVDYFLLEDAQGIVSHSTIEKITKLNVMEKVLLLIHFIRNKRVEEAVSIAQHLENENRTFSYDQKSFKKYFDTILGSKSIESEGLAQNMDAFSNFSNIAPVQQCMMSMNAAPRMMSRGAPIQNQMSHTERDYGVHKMKKMMCMKKESSPLNDVLLLDASNDNFEEENAYIEQRSKFIEEFKNLEKTKEYAERHYYNIKTIEESYTLIDNNTFWVELTKHLLEKGLEVPFLSSKFIYCTKNHATMIAVLSFIGLPFEFGNHNYENLSGKGLEIQAASNLIVFHKSLKECKSNLKIDLLIAQRFYDPSDRYQISDEDPDVKYEKDVDEYIVDKIYGCEVIITNVSVTRQEFQVLYEIPEGALPVNKNDYTKSTTLIVNTFTTQTLNYFFYFPKSGKFKVYPANISRNGLVLAVAKETVFDVNNERISKKLETIDQILAQGSKDDILNFVANKNIQNREIFQFRNIYYLLKDKEFYLKLIRILRKRNIYDHTTWSFSLYHDDLASLREFINTPEIINQLKSTIKFFSNELLSIKNIRLLEYYPLMNARVHQLSLEKSNILNKELKSQYRSFLEYLIEVPQAKPEDLIALVYYMLLQDRIDEAIKIFNRIDEKALDKCNNVCHLQYDYFKGYLDFYIGYPNFKIAREICEKYLDYPVLSWRNLFYEMANQLAEYDGEELIDDTVAMQDKKLTEKQANIKSAKTEEILNAELQNDEIVIVHQNCNELIFNYYLIDLEVLYSRNPFLLQVIIFL